MKRIYVILFMAILVVGCQPPADNSVNEAFEKNSKTVLAYLEGVQNESIDYAIFADDFISNGTGYGSPDSLTLEEKKVSDKGLFDMYDIELSPNPVILLPGVNVDTKEADGSVRYYGTWTVTLPATDSTEAKSGKIKSYESFDFNEDGKIIFMQFFADVSGLMAYLQGSE